MKNLLFRSPSFRSLSWLGVFLLAASSAFSAASVEFTTCPQSRSMVTVEGTSTLHDWLVRGRVIEGAVQIPQTLLAGESAAAAPVAIEGKLIVPSRSMRSFRGGRPYSARMDEIMYEKLQTETYRNIEYAAKSVVLKEPGPDASGSLKAEASGTLTVAGVAREVTVPVELKRLEDSRWQLSTRINLKMSDFQIEPPVALMGSIRTGDEITIVVEWVVAPKEKP
jgi:polyisoprenoid-binding protein YceI